MHLPSRLYYGATPDDLVTLHACGIVPGDDGLVHMSQRQEEAFASARRRVVTDRTSLYLLEIDTDYLDPSLVALSSGEAPCYAYGGEVCPIAICRILKRSLS